MALIQTYSPSPLSLLRRRINTSRFWIRFLHWEYWPAKITNIPVIGFWLYFAAKARHLFYFTAANPNIETGGVLGESKIDILNQVPEAYKPATLFVKAHSSWQHILSAIQEKGIGYPLIVKPNVGERGNGVEKIDDQDALIQYLAHCQTDLIIQEYIDYPEEYSVLYVRFPDQHTGNITSLCQKEYLHVEGNGQQSLLELIQDYPRANLQIEALRKRLGTAIHSIPVAGEKVLLMPIGNHARGTKFLNANDAIDQQLTMVFDQLSHQLTGIYVGRFDLKTQSLNDLKQGKEFKILEINGVAGEPAHIYAPTYPVRQAYKDLFQHWKTIYQISREVHRRGVPYMSFGEAWNRLWNYLRYLKTLS